MAGGRSDSDLVAASQTGDHDAFGELVARYRDAVFGVALHRLGNFEIAQDTVQETFIKAFQRLSSLRDATRFGHWLYRIADNIALNMIRRPITETSLDSIVEQPTADPNLARQTETDELAQRVIKALAELPDSTRLAVILHYINGYTHAEVASFLDTTAGAIKSRISRARSQLGQEVLGMIEETFEKTDFGFIWKVTHPSGKAKMALGCAGPGFKKEEMRKLAHATLWLDPDLRSEPDWSRNYRKSLKWLVEYLLRGIFRAGITGLRMEYASSDADPQNPHLNANYLPESIAPSWSHPSYIWDPIREELAKLAEVKLMPDTIQAQGIIRFHHKGRIHDLKVIFTPTTIEIERESA